MIILKKFDSSNKPAESIGRALSCIEDLQKHMKDRSIPSEARKLCNQLEDVLKNAYEGYLKEQKKYPTTWFLIKFPDEEKYCVLPILWDKKVPKDQVANFIALTLEHEYGAHPPFSYATRNSYEDVQEKLSMDNCDEWEYLDPRKLKDSLREWLDTSEL